MRQTEDLIILLLRHSEVDAEDPKGKDEENGRGRRRLPPGEREPCVDPGASRLLSGGRVLVCGGGGQRALQVPPNSEPRGRHPEERSGVAAVGRYSSIQPSSPGLRLMGFFAQIPRMIPLTLPPHQRFLICTQRSKQIDFGIRVCARDWTNEDEEEERRSPEVQRRRGKWAKSEERERGKRFTNKLIDVWESEKWHMHDAVCMVYLFRKGRVKCPEIHSSDCYYDIKMVPT